MVVAKAKNAASANYEQILPKEVVEVFHKNFTKFSNVQVSEFSVEKKNK